MPGTRGLQEIAAAVAEGAEAHLKRQYMTIGMVGIGDFRPSGLLPRHAGCDRSSWSARSTFGRRWFIRMERSGFATCTAQAATTSLAVDSELASKAGAITGMRLPVPPCWASPSISPDLTHGLGLKANDRVVVYALVALGFGALLISIFARLGGGIFTKGADVGGDLVGKVEAGIPEDDPRTRPRSPTTSATTSAIAPAWPPTVRPTR